MDRRVLERLGHYVVSRRVALGYRSRADLADDVQFTLRTLADIEHGVRKASPGTYAMLENKLAWAPAASTRSSPGANPKTSSSISAVPLGSPFPRRQRRSLPGLYLGTAAGATPPHHPAPRETPRNLGQLGQPRLAG